MVQYIFEVHLVQILNIPLGWNHTIKFFAPFSCINRMKGRASLWLTIAGTCRQFYCAAV